MKNKFLFFLIVTLQSCLNLTDPEYQAQYIESYKSFNSELVSHFPLKAPNNWIAASYGSPKYINEYSRNTIFRLEISVSSKEKFERLKRELVANSKVVKNSSDTCFLLVDSKENQNQAKYDNYFPIPQETIYDFDFNKWTKKENCEVALIDYKSGVFVESKHLTAKEYLPKNWRNGYSKGYAFDNRKQIIMYWLIIW